MAIKYDEKDNLIVYAMPGGSPARDLRELKARVKAVSKKKPLPRRKQANISKIKTVYT